MITAIIATNTAAPAAVSIAGIDELLSLSFFEESSAAFELSETEELSAADELSGALLSVVLSAVLLSCCELSKEDASSELSSPSTISAAVAIGIFVPSGIPLLGYSWALCPSASWAS